MATNHPPGQPPAIPPLPGDEGVGRTRLQVLLRPWGDYLAGLAVGTGLFAAGWFAAAFLTRAPGGDGFVPYVIGVVILSTMAATLAHSLRVWLRGVAARWAPLVTEWLQRLEEGTDRLTVALEAMAVRSPKEQPLLREWSECARDNGEHLVAGLEQYFPALPPNKAEWLRPWLSRLGGPGWKVAGVTALALLVLAKGAAAGAMLSNALLTRPGLAAFGLGLVAVLFFGILYVVVSAWPEKRTRQVNAWRSQVEGRAWAFAHHLRLLAHRLPQERSALQALARGAEENCVLLRDGLACHLPEVVLVPERTTLGAIEPEDFAQAYPRTAQELARQLRAATRNCLALQTRCQHLRYRLDKQARLLAQQEQARRQSQQVKPAPQPKAKGLSHAQKRRVLRLFAHELGHHAEAQRSGASPHERLVQSFRNYIQQDLRALSDWAFDEWRGKGGQREGVGPRTLSQHLVQVVMERGSEQLASPVLFDRGGNVTPEQAEAILEKVGEKVRRQLDAWLETTYGPGVVVGKLREEIDQVVRDGLRLVLEMLTATPPARLLFASKGATFNPLFHTEITGRAESGEPITHSYAPAYVIHELRVAEKAQVMTGKTNPAPGK